MTKAMLLMLASGVLLGAGLSDLYYKTKYEKITEIEVESIKKVYSDRTRAEREKFDKQVEVLTNSPRSEKCAKDAEDIMVDNGYIPGEKPKEKLPMVAITMGDYENDDEYSKDTLEYSVEEDLLHDEYADLVDRNTRSDWGIDELLTENPQDPTSENNCDIIYLRNEEDATDYAITRYFPHKDL